MQVSRGIERSIEEVSRINTPELRTEARSIHQVSRSYRAYRPNLDRSTRCRGAGEIAIRKSLKEARQIASYQGDIEEVSSQLLKTVFQDVKNTYMNAIQHATQPTIQSTY